MIWAGLVVVFLVIEAATVGLASLWFALGAAAALSLAFTAPDTIAWQVVLFIAVSALTSCLQDRWRKNTSSQN